MADDVPVGREAEWSAVSWLADELSRGRGGVLWIDGEPGMGKTALVDALAASARHGVTVLRACGDELLANFPLRLMADCLGVSGRAADPELVRIAALPRGGAEAGERMLAVVERLGTRGPVLLALEDLQWSDEPSLELWGRLARTAERAPLLLVGTARPAPRRDAVDRIRELANESESEGRGLLFELSPLADADAARLAGELAGGMASARLRRELARAGGNPLHIKSLVNALRGEGLVTVTETGAAAFAGPAGVTPDALVAAVGSSLGFLPDEAISTLRMAALLGGRVDPARLAAVALAEPASIAHALDAGERAGVLRAGERPDFRNELIREVLIRQIPGSLRRTLHGHIARTLVELGDSDTAVIEHLHASGESLDAWAVEWLTQVPQPVLDAVPSDAVPVLRRAMDAVARDSEPMDAARGTWRDLAVRLPGVLFLAGRDEEAFELARLLAEQVEGPELAARMSELAARAALRTGRWREVVELVDGALADDGLPPRWRPQLRALASIALSWLGDPRRAAAAAAEALDEARAWGEPPAIAVAHHAASLCAAPASASALEHNSAALAALSSFADTHPAAAHLRVMLTMTRMSWVYEHGDREEYRSLLDQVRRRGGQPNGMHSSMVLLRAAAIAYRGGYWDEALGLLDESDPDQLPPPELVLAQSLRVLIHVHRGERERAAAALSDAEETARRWPRDDPANDPVVVARAAAAEAGGAPERALELLAALEAAPREDRGLREEMAPVLVRLALAAGDRELARTVTESLERAAAAEPGPRRAVLARWCRGQLDDDPEELLAVAATMADVSWPFDSAGARHEAAIRLAAGGEGREPDADRARAELTAAVQQYAQMRAEWDIRRADAAVRAYGVRRGPRGAHRRETTGWESLTDSERRVARLVGQGWSNPAIAAELMLSRHTVQTHVSSILGKLRLGSRIEVVRAVSGNRATR